MDPSVLPYVARIRSIEPDLDFSDARLETEGLANDVVVADGQVWRFAKGEGSARAMEREVRVLERLRGRTTLAIPTPHYCAAGVMAYRYLAGQTLDRDVLQGLTPEVRRRLAGQMGTFLKEVHSVEVDGIEPTDAPTSYARQSDLWRDVEALVFPLLLGHQRRWAQRLRDSMMGDPQNSEYVPRIIHGDLAPYHILFDLEPCRVCGVIDFGTAGAGDPANDLACLLQAFGGEFVSGVLGAYPELREAMPRARYYCQMLELQWVVQGLKYGQPFWFAAHLGNARDLG